MIHSFNKEKFSIHQLLRCSGFHWMQQHVWWEITPHPSHYWQENLISATAKNWSRMVCKQNSKWWSSWQVPAVHNSTLHFIWWKQLFWSLLNRVYFQLPRQRFVGLLEDSTIGGNTCGIAAEYFLRIMKFCYYYVLKTALFSFLFSLAKKNLLSEDASKLA